MKITLVALALAVVVVVLVSSPLFRGAANRTLGRGKEDDSPIRLWQEEKDRLTGQLRDNDLALAEGRVDAREHDAVAARLAAEADHALVRLRQAREGLTPAAAETARPVRAWRAAAGAVLVLAVAYGAHAFASLSDIDMTNHADAGEQSAAGSRGAMPVGANGAPDIGAMVARLEARIEAGDYTADDAAMLLRSYGTLGREADAKGLLDKALKTFPDDVNIKLTFVDAALSGSDPTMATRAQAMVDDMLKAEPDLPEARWYRSLFLVRQGDLENARKELHALQPLIAGNKEAVDAVASLLARLDIPQHDQLQPDN